MALRAETPSGAVDRRLRGAILGKGANLTFWEGRELVDATLGRSSSMPRGPLGFSTSLPLVGEELTEELTEDCSDSGG